MVASLLDRCRAADAAARAAGRSWMLGVRDVQQDLGLTPEQAAALPRYSDRSSPGPGGPPGRRNGDERQRAAIARAAEFETALEQALGPERNERLKQIQRQVRGTMAFGEPEVIQRLGLTREQRGKLRQIRERFRNSLDRSTTSPTTMPPEPPDRPRALEQQEILGIFTPQQLQAWRELTGPEFVGHVGPPPGPDRGGPGGPGGASVGPGNHERPLRP
jgi:hypothetical protein